MIFVTIGSVFPFDRLIRAVDLWARDNPAEEAFAQIGAGGYEPRHMRWVRRLDQDAFLETVRRSRLLVAHAGMGSVITAGQSGKPIVIVPRLRNRGEHNTDHQIDTAAWLKGRPGIYVASGDDEISARIGEALSLPPDGIRTLPPHAPAEFIARLRKAILA